MISMDDDKDKEMIMDILDVIMKDMGAMGAKRLIPHDGAMAVDVSAHPMDEDEAKEKLEDAMDMDMDGQEGSPEEEASESPEEEKEEGDEGDEEDLSSLPRWKQRLKMGK